jgi:hypothetical protein
VSISTERIFIPSGKSFNSADETKCLGGLNANMVTEWPSLANVFEKIKIYVGESNRLKKEYNLRKVETPLVEKKFSLVPKRMELKSPPTLRITKKNSLRPA